MSETAASCRILIFFCFFVKMSSLKIRVAQSTWFLCLVGKYFRKKKMRFEFSRSDQDQFGFGRLSNLHYVLF